MNTRLIGRFLLVILGLSAEVASAAQSIHYQPDKEWQLDKEWPQTSLRFGEVSWVDVDPIESTIYVLQRSQPAVAVFSPAGALLSSWTTEELGDPHSLSLQRLPDGSQVLWITDMAPPQPAGPGFGHCLKRFTVDGDYLGSIGTCAADSGGTDLNPLQFDKVTDVAFDSLGNLLVTDGDLDGLNNRLLKLGPTGEVLAVWSAPDNQPGSGPLEFDLPHAVVVDDCDRVWVADALNHRVQVMSGVGDFLGQLSCFGQNGVYGISMAGSMGGGSTLFVTSSPTDGGGGWVSLFAVPTVCSELISFACSPLAQWQIELGSTPETAMLHSASVSRDGRSLYLAELGGDLPPQKWTTTGTQ